jgi:glycosyltransferase involved in cell wall biosynthesis
MDKNFNQEIKWNNLYLDNFKHKFLNSEKTIAINSNLDAPDLDENLNLFNPDIVIIYGYWQKIQKKTYNWVLKNNKKIAYISDTELKRKSNYLIDLLKSIYLKYFFSKINYFLVVGDSNTHFYKSHGVNDKKLIYSPFPIDLLHFKKKKLNYLIIRNRIRKMYSVKDDEILLSMVGKAVKWKRPIDAINLLLALEQKSTTKFCLIIIGSGPQLEELKIASKDLKKNRVIFPGFVIPEDLPDYYAATDIYIHTAELEPHSLAISEAIYMNCPIILSDRCGSYGLSDDVQLGVNGEIYECGNIENLTSLILKLVSNPILLKNFSENSGRIGEYKQEQAHYRSISTLIHKIKISE